MKRMSTSDRVMALFKLARMDPKYAELSMEYKKLEIELGELAKSLTEQQQDILWGFICTSDAMNWRMLEIICEIIKLDET